MSALLDITKVDKVFHLPGRDVVALSDVSVGIAPGECHAIVGESGSGKSTLANLILGLMAPSAGTLTWKGAPLSTPRGLAMKRSIQLVQQNPYSALNPRRSIGASLRLPLDVHGIGPAKERADKVASLLASVGLPANYAHQRPASLSGGERQRVAIARALASEPELIVLDEPTASLDVLVQARVLRLLMNIRRAMRLTYVFITHDLAVVRAIADRVSVFQEGRLVETGIADQIFNAPRSAYTKALIAAVPVVSAADIALRSRIQNTLSIDPKVS